MRSAAAKRLVGGQEITKVVVWGSMSQDGDGALERTTYVLVGTRYYENGDLAEEGWQLSQALNTDAVLELHTANGLAWESKARIVRDITGAEVV